jgi:hypothetical protein
LALSDAQLRVVMAHAAGLPSCWRSRFLAGVSDLLQALDHIDDVAVAGAATEVRFRMLGGGDAA